MDGNFYKDKYRDRERGAQLKAIIEKMRELGITLEDIANYQENNVTEDRIRLLNIRKRQLARDTEDGRRRRQKVTG